MFHLRNFAIRILVYQTPLLLVCFNYLICCCWDCYVLFSLSPRVHLKDLRVVQNLKKKTKKKTLSGAFFLYICGIEFSVHFLMGIDLCWSIEYMLYRTVLYIQITWIKKRGKTKQWGRCWPSAYTAIRNASNVPVIRSLSKTLTSSVLLLEEELSYPHPVCCIYSSIKYYNSQHWLTLALLDDDEAK